ncbi:30S ribosomal protein S4 [Rickettsiales bacterium]|nr:30S ribosomal protein S4 [Rickettsiales bacterium]
MTKIIKSKNKIARSTGVNLWGKEDVSSARLNVRPGQKQSRGPRRLSDYGAQLNEKQKLRFHYNISEKQFKNIFKLAAKQKGDTGESFIALLESRLDSVVYRSNIAPTIFSAKQLISHKHIKVNGKIVNISSYKLKIGDVVSIRDKSKKINLIVESLDKLERDVPEYLRLDQEDQSVEVVAKAAFSDVPYAFEVNVNLIIEFYSR